MRCKVGDLAVIVRSEFGNDGKIVQCLERYDGPWRGLEYLPGWRVDRSVNTELGPSKYVPDFKLRPIRDNDGTDETLVWTERPVGAHA